ncbi:MAG TPA: DUF4136 domain-containing protein [Allosphingosinicella sp.]|nr:DUF4136 domain-containing protein [Allosphingosinicella sp.]
MKRLGTALAIALSLAGCQTSRSGGGGGRQAGGVDVTRTHLGQQLARAQIAVEPVNAADANNPEFRAFADAVERHLARHGYTIAPNRPASEQIARVTVTQGSRAALTTGWPAGLGQGSRQANVVATLLDVRIQRRSDGTVFWQGRAVAEAPAGTPRAAVVERLAEALFRDFPGESGRTIRIR